MKKIYMALVVVAVLLLLVIWQARQRFLKRDFVAARGNLTLTESPELKKTLNAFLESKYRNFMCAHRFLGKDDHYIYVEVYCGKFSLDEAENVHMDLGARIPTRIEYSLPDFKLGKIDQPGDGTGFIKDFKKLFPFESFKVWSSGLGNGGAMKMLDEEIRDRIKKRSAST